MTPRNDTFDAFVGTRVLETLDNYARSYRQEIISGNAKPEARHAFSSSGSFWNEVLSQPGSYYETVISLVDFSLTHWVPRVPGFFWTEDGKLLRKLGSGMPRRVGNKWMHYAPMSKSMHVMGGIGTLQFAPEDGFRMLCLVDENRNASAGIPVLIKEEIYGQLSVEEGMVVNIKDARWVSMKETWALRFPFTRGIPRACVLVDDVKQVEASADTEPVEFHPFTIMQYNDGDGFFYDYVFCTGLTLNAYQTNEIIDFFEEYRREYGHNGEYLVAADPLGTLFKSSYASPRELLQNEVSGKTMLEMLELRVKSTYYNKSSLDSIIKKLTTLYIRSDDIRRLAVLLGLPTGSLRDGSTGIMINQLVLLCEKQQLLEKLVELAVREHGYVFLN